MKKIYTLLLAAVSVLSLLCMNEQKQRPQIIQQQDTNIAQHFTYNPQTLTMVPITPINESFYTPSCTANQEGWQQLNKIMDPPYHSLKHITSQTQQTNQKDKKPLLLTNEPKECSSHIMQNLYETAYSMVYYHQHKEKELSHGSKDDLFIYLIHNMNNAKKNGITEDMAGRFAYTKYDQDDISKYIPLVFSCLKKYMLINLKIHASYSDAENTKKNLYDEKLAQALNITLKDLSTNTISTEDSSFINIVNSLKKLIECESNINHLKDLTDYLYSDKKLIFIHTIPFDPSIIENFYKTASCLLIDDSSKSTWGDVYRITQLIIMAKEKGLIKNENELGYKILTYKSPMESNIISNTISTLAVSDTFANILQKSLSYIGIEYISSKTTSTELLKKNCVAIFCKLIEKYTQTTKKLPPIAHYLMYNAAKELDVIIFPDHCSDNDNDLLDENVYALNEFKQLIDDTTTLIQSDYRTIQLCVDQLYPLQGSK